MITEIENEIEKVLSKKPYIFRQSAERRELDGLSAAVLANMDMAGSGPAQRIMVGRKVAYPATSYREWLMGRIKPVDMAQ